MVRYKMVGRDVNSNPTQYRTWIVPNTPDLTGQLYTGPKSGRNPLVDITAYAIDDDAVIADFNFPKATTWQPHPSELVKDFPIRKVIPGKVADSHSLVLDGYIYLFGGNVTDKIFRATISNPADFIDTGARLPTPLYGGALAIVGSRIYIFGGNNGDNNNMGLGSVDTIFSAPVSDPLSWTNHGSLLPRKVHYSNLGMYNGQLYLFGGREINVATDRIVTASVFNPLVWTDTGFKIPTPTYGSIFAQLTDKWIIYGGLLFPDTPTDVIWSAPITSPTTWSLDGYLLYPTAFGQFFTIGNDGYMIGPMVEPPHTTTINHLSNGFILPDGYSNPPNSIFVQSVTGFPSIGTITISDTAGADVVNYTGITRNPDPTRFAPGDGYSFDNITGGIGKLSTGDTVSFLPNGFTPILQCSLSRPNVFIDTLSYVRGVISHSNLALVYDKVWLYGGSGETAIFACHQQLKYDYYNPLVEQYAQATRVLLPATDNLYDPYVALGIPYWKTDYLRGGIGPTIEPILIALSAGNPGAPTLYNLHPKTLHVFKSSQLANLYITGINAIFLNNYLWVLAETSNTFIDPNWGTINVCHVLQIDPGSLAVVNTIVLPNEAYSMTTDDSRYLYISCYNGPPFLKATTRVDTQTLAVTSYTNPLFVPLGGQPIVLIQYDPVTGCLFESSTVSVAKITPDFSTYTAVSGTINDGSHQAESAAAGAGSIWTSLYAFSSTIPIQRINPITAVVEVTITTPARSTSFPGFNSLAYNSKYNLLFSAVGASGQFPNIYYIDPNTNTITGFYQGPGTGSGEAAVVATHDDFLWAATGNIGFSISGYVSYIDLATKAVIATANIDSTGIASLTRIPQ